MNENTKTVDVLAVMAKGGVSARIERRYWYVDGKYLGNASQFVPVDPFALAAELTGDFYGEWNGARHVDGREVLRGDVERAIDYRLAVFERVVHHGEQLGHPIRLGDWGEYRIVTDDAALSRIAGVK